MTKKELRLLTEALKYEPKTGLFYWRLRLSKRIQVGAVAGCLNRQGYVVIRAYSKLYLAHRLAYLFVYGKTPNVVDHVNRNKQDNRIANIRNCTMAENNDNRDRLKTNSSGKEGVSYCKTYSKYVAYIEYKGKRKNLGYRVDFNAAVSLRKAAEVKLLGKESSR